MEILTIYAAVAGSILMGLAITRALVYLGPWNNAIYIFVAENFMYPYVLGRHSFLGPWTRAGILMHLGYATSNIFLVFFGSPSLRMAGSRAGTLSLINTVFLMASLSQSNVADLLGISVKACRRIHRAVGWMVLSLGAFHTVVMLMNQRSEKLEENRRLFAIIGAGCLVALGLLSFFPCRRISYECFLRSHQALAVIGVYGIWRHLPSEDLLPRLYIYIAFGILLCIFFSNLGLFLFRNGLFSGKGRPRAMITYQRDGIEIEKNEHATNVTPIKISLYLPRPITVMAGQYINLWLPSVSMCSWAQTHPFMVTSWSRGRHGTLELWVEPHQGLSMTLAQRANFMGLDGFSCLALYSGPHGITAPVDNYESILLVASGTGLAAVIPYVKKLIYGYNTCTSQVRRVNLVWQVESLRIAISMEELLNDLLTDDELDNGYILTISVFVENGSLVKNKMLGKHERAFLYQGTPDYPRIIQEEVSGKYIERLPTIQDSLGEVLLLSSTRSHLRDELRQIVRGHLHQSLKMIELEYQP